jgi:hypothetical protein
MTPQAIIARRLGVGDNETWAYSTACGIYAELDKHGYIDRGPSPWREAWLCWCSLGGPVFGFLAGFFVAGWL